MAPKRKKDVEFEEISEDEAPKSEPKKKRASKPKAAALIEPFTDEAGWNIVPPSILWKDFGSEPNSKIAGVDLDGTIVNVKSGAQFPRTADDYKMFNKKVKKVLEGYVEDGYKIVIFTNQGGIKGALTGAMAKKVTGRIDKVIEELGVPAQVIMATQDDDNRKPKTGMWEFFKSNCNGDIVPDLSETFYIGDAAGRPLDFADSDKQLAANIGIEFRTPEEVFGEMDGKKAVRTAQAAASDAGISGVNKELVDVFNRLAELYAGDRFKGSAFRKAANMLATFPDKITTANLKDVGKLPGVGKGSLAHIKEWLDTGKVAVLEEIEGAGAPEGAKKAVAAAEKAKSTALAFM